MRCLDGLTPSKPTPIAVRTTSKTKCAPRASSRLEPSAAELARQVEVPVNRITEIMNGQRGVTADTALRLGHWFGTSPEYWLNLQKLYELRRAREEVGDQLKKLPTLVRRKADDL